MLVDRRPHGGVQGPAVPGPALAGHVGDRRLPLESAGGRHAIRLGAEATEKVLPEIAEAIAALSHPVPESAAAK